MIQCSEVDSMFHCYGPLWIPNLRKLKALWFEGPRVFCAGRSRDFKGLAAGYGFGEASLKQVQGFKARMKDNKHKKAAKDLGRFPPSTL